MPTTKRQKLEVIHSSWEMRDIVQAARATGKQVGFVPTMGALHEGHLSLVDAALQECDRTAVSIFVNPTQFGPHEDHARYPRTLERDCDLLAERGCDYVFAPADGEIYQPGHETYVEVGPVAAPWEGSIRPGHFRGVATVVLKLFNIVPATRAYFGRKDYQQSLVVKRMAADFDLPIEIVVCPIVREPDGLAMSSRNAYLNPEERRQAAALYRSLMLAESRVDAGETNPREIEAAMRELLAQSGIRDIDYIALLADGTVESVAQINGPTVVALAVRVGATRLIDNHTIG